MFVRILKDLKNRAETLPSPSFCINDHSCFFSQHQANFLLNFMKYISFYSNMLRVVTKSGKSRKYKIVIGKCLK